MTHLSEFGIQTVYKHWLDAAASLLEYQWKLFEAQYKGGLEIIEAALRGTGRSPDVTSTPAGTPEVGPAAGGELQKLKRLAAERISQGLAPPKEIYQVQYRGQIDWEKYPLWARPSDPELFEGCGHEG
jgi:hypothetical protein